jgi:hypothetical protein
MLLGTYYTSFGILTLSLTQTYCCLAFFFNYLDRAALSNAYVSGLKEDLNLVGNDYNVLTTCLTVGCKSPYRQVTLHPLTSER